jgi:hypothetical protein
MEPTKARSDKKQKSKYQTPVLREYGLVSKLTLKPGSRGDGSPGTKGDKGVSS